MSDHHFPPHVLAEVQRVLEQEARRAVQAHLRDCVNEHGKYDLTPVPGKVGTWTCDRCGETLYNDEGLRAARR